MNLNPSGHTMDPNFPHSGPPPRLFPFFPIYQGPIFGNEGSISNSIFNLSLNYILGFRV